VYRKKNEKKVRIERIVKDKRMGLTVFYNGRKDMFTTIEDDGGEDAIRSHLKRNSNAKGAVYEICEKSSYGILLSTVPPVRCLMRMLRSGELEKFKIYENIGM
jgi:hypothetical protein